MIRNKVQQFSSCVHRGGSPFLCKAIEQLSLLTGRTTASRGIVISACSQSQSKLLRYDRESSVRQANTNYELKNLTMDSPVTNLRASWFPTEDTPNKSFYGIRFSDIHIIHIKATRNNTIISANEAETGKAIALQSGGTVGFRNARKGTNVAAQATAVALAGDVLRKNITTVRVCLRGLGPGREPALKSLQMTGLNIVSITDTTRLPHSGNRPKKVRRL